MNLKKIRSPKHKGAIFLRLKEHNGAFICKVYPANNANYIADTIIRACEKIEEDKQCRLTMKSATCQTKTSNASTNIHREG